MSPVTWLTEPLGLVIVAVVTVGGSWLTARASTRSAQRTTAQTVAGQIASVQIQAEQGAYERAKAFYVDVIDRQDSEIKELEAEVATLKARATKQDVALDRCQRACRALARKNGVDIDLEEF